MKEWKTNSDILLRGPCQTTKTQRQDSPLNFQRYLEKRNQIGIKNKDTTSNKNKTGKDKHKLKS